MHPDREDEGRRSSDEGSRTIRDEPASSLRDPDRLPERIGRFHIGERLGAGGMGVVHRAVDVEQQREVAVKSLHRLDPAGLHRIKAEFRAVAGIAHDNLVLLHELVSLDGRWLLVMDLVDGEALVRHVRGALDAEEARLLADARDAPTIHDDAPLPPPLHGPAVRRGLDAEGEARLRAALPQLVRGVSALHRAGMLHRDLKPSNVLVERGTGRVVVLDFGLATPEGAGGEPSGRVAGTPAYMAPEQAQGWAVSAASDWYAVGVMLFEALTGDLPFSGDAEEILAAKTSREALAPSSLVPDVPPDLDGLTVALLRRAPEARPSGEEVAAWLQDGPPAPTSRRVGPPLRLVLPQRLAEQPRAIGRAPPDRDPALASGERLVAAAGTARPADAWPAVALLGRERELAALSDAFAASERSAVAVLVAGPSGVGKSSLVRAFVDDLREREGTLVLWGRCYERESVPYKAFDALVDALERHLVALREDDRATLLPPGLHELARIFPVLREVAGSLAPARAPGGPDPGELLARAFQCLKLLLARLAARQRLVLVIDDLQWGDRDSGRLLAELLAPPECPSILLLCTYRSEEVAHSPLLADIARGTFLGEARRLHVAPLPEAAAVSLALDLLERRRGALPPEGLAERIAREAEGSPFFIEQLARWADVDGAGGAAATIEGLVVARKDRLPEDARALLEAVCVAGRPVAQGVAAAAVAIEDPLGPVATLRAAHLVRTRGARLEDAIEPYHDRIRESVAASLGDAARAAWHLALARAEEATGRADPQDLALHYHAAGLPEAAEGHAVRAAEEAERALAFERAADLWALAAGCARAASDEVSHATRRADALVHAGRCAAAAPIYLDASRRTSDAVAWELRRRAAEQLLVSGRIDEGTGTLAPVLEEVGIAMPSSNRRALLALLGRVLSVELARRRPRRLRVGGASPQARARFSACWSAGKGLLSVDPIRGAYFFVRALEVALRSGDPRDVARGLSIYGMMQVFEGAEAAHRRGLAVLDEAASIARPLADPYLDGVLSICRGTAAMSVGQLREGLSAMEAGIEVLEESCTGVTWEVATGRSSCFNARLWLGEIGAIARAAPLWQRTSARLGNQFATVTSELYGAFGDLVRGDVGAARARLRRAIAGWTRQGYHFQHWLADKVEIWCDLYEERHEEAWDRCARVWPALEGSNLLRVQLMRIDALLLRGRVAIATARRRPSRLDVAVRAAAELARIGRPMAQAGAALLRAQVAALRGPPSDARAPFERAAAAADACDLRLIAESARRAAGQLRGDDLGAALVARVDRWMASEGVADPRRLAGVFATSDAV